MIAIQLIDTFEQNVGGWSLNIEDEEMGRRKFLTAAAAQKRVVLGDPGWSRLVEWGGAQWAPTSLTGWAAQYRPGRLAGWLAALCTRGDAALPTDS